MIKKFLQSKANQQEIIRFIIVGVICTGADYLVSSLFQFVIFPSNEIWHVLFLRLNAGVLVASLMGFTVGVIINYILSITTVFKNTADKKAGKSATGFILFVALSIVGYLINYGIKELGNAVIPFKDSFLWFTFVFGVATFIVLIYNYLSRKFFIFKPTQTEENIDEKN